MVLWNLLGSLLEGSIYGSLRCFDTFARLLLLGGGFKYFLFSPLPGEMIQFD